MNETTQEHSTNKIQKHSTNNTKHNIYTITRITRTPTQLSKHPHIHSPTYYKTSLGGGLA